VAVAVEALRVYAPEVPNTRESYADQSIEKLVHALTAQGHPAANFIPFPQTEAADRSLRLGDLRLLTGDLRELLRGLGKPVFVLERFADAHVHHDLLQARQAEHIGAAELFLLPGCDLFLVPLKKPSHCQPFLSDRALS